MVPHDLKDMTNTQLLSIIVEERAKFVEFEQSYIQLREKYIDLLNGDIVEEQIPRR